MGRPGEDSPYRRWVQAEGLDIVEAHYVWNLGELALRPWARTGGAACFINHEQSDRTNDCRVLEIPPGGSLTPQRHLHEQMVYVLSGRGIAQVWQPTGAQRQSFEWGEGALFSIPLNANYELFNSSGTDSACLVAVTNAPAVMNMFADPDFVYACDYEFLDRFRGEDGYFDPEGEVEARYLQSNFVPDLRTVQLYDHPERGAGGRNVGFNMAGNVMAAHVSEFPVGTYKKAHRHGAGAHVIILSGVGYSMMWSEGESPERYDWAAGSMITPPEGVFHQHFNTGPEPASYLALRVERARNIDPKTLRPMSQISTREGGDQIDYEDEDPEIRRTYRDECERNGAEYGMDAFFVPA